MTSGRIPPRALKLRCGANQAPRSSETWDRQTGSVPPRRGSRDVFVGGDLSPGQLRRLAIESGRHGSLVLLLETVGLRWGEAAALRAWATSTFCTPCPQRPQPLPGR